MTTLHTLPTLRQAGFTGFQNIHALFTDTSAIPDIRGVYLVLRLAQTKPEFLETGTGGFFRNDNPNVPIEKLAANWVDQAIVLYIGKAGGGTSKATLRSRLKPYLAFGQGKKAPHWGGRLIWQLADAADLVLCWKPLPDAEPRAMERELIVQFIDQYGKRPFANLTG